MTPRDTPRHRSLPTPSSLKGYEYEPSRFQARRSLLRGRFGQQTACGRRNLAAVRWWIKWHAVR